MNLSPRTLKIAGAALAACVVIVVVAVVAFAGGGHKKKVAATPTATPTTSASATTSKPVPKPVPKPAAVDPLTGGKPVKGPAIAVKIDDVAAGRPQLGVEQANIVYVEQVEGGLTRLIAIFHTARPRVGPVRSVRSNDPTILAQYGPIGFVASGGGGDSLPALDASHLKADINDRGGPGFYRDGSREAPHNLMVDLSKVPGAAPSSGGLTWSRTAPDLAHAPAAPGLRTVVGGTQVSFVYSARANRYVRVIDGVRQHAASGALVTTPNVIVMFCTGYTNPADIDPAGNPGHFTKTVGSGRLAVFRNGHRIDGKWSRPSTRSATAYNDARGKAIPLMPGGAWIILVENGAPLTS